jgi:hypothetical protein
MLAVAIQEDNAISRVIAKVVADSTAAAKFANRLDVGPEFRQRFLLHLFFLRLCIDH